MYACKYIRYDIKIIHESFARYEMGVALLNYFHAVKGASNSIIFILYFKLLKLGCMSVAVGIPQLKL